MTVLSSHTLSSTAGIFPPPLGRQLLTSSLDSSLVLWEISSSNPLFKLSAFMPANSPSMDPALHGITALAVSPDGKLAAVGGASGRVKLVSLPKGDVVGKLEGHRDGESIEGLVFIDLLNGARRPNVFRTVGEVGRTFSGGIISTPKRVTGFATSIYRKTDKAKMDETKNLINDDDVE